MHSIFANINSRRHLGGRGGAYPPHSGGRSGMFGAGGPLGGGFGGGAGMRAAKMLGSGDLQLIILLLLAERPRHGYEIIKAIETHSSGVYTPSPGMVYPALTYLEETGYALAAAEGNKKLFTLTEDGSRHLAQNRAAANELWNQLSLFGKKFARARQHFSEEEDIAAHFDGHACGPEDKHQFKAEFRNLRDQFKAAIFDKIDASAEEKQRVLDVIRRAVEEIRGK